MSEIPAVDSLAKLVADVAADIRAAVANKSNFALDLPLVFPLIQDVESVAGSAGSLVSQLKAMDAAGLQQLEADAVVIFSAAVGEAPSSKLTAYVQAAIGVLTNVYNAIEAK